MCMVYVYLARKPDGSLEPGVTNSILEQLVEDDASLAWCALQKSEDEAITEKERLHLLSREEKESILPWYSPDPEFRKANTLLDHYFKVTPPPINGMASKDYHEWLEALHRPVRGPLVRRYAWAIPTQEAIQVLVDRGPIVEMGAGTGYWASLVELMGGDVVAYDVQPPNNTGTLDEWNIWHAGFKFTEVAKGGPSELVNHSDRTLFLCWPPAGNPMASECLRYWDGEILVYVGDDEVTADESFYKQLQERFSLTQVIPIPQWTGVKDKMTIWRRYNLD